jgi:hypothetical protein
MIGFEAVSSASLAICNSNLQIARDAGASGRGGHAAKGVDNYPYYLLIIFIKII